MERYIVKWQVRGLNRKYQDRYLASFTVFSDGTLDDYTMSFNETGAVKLPEPVAKWVCQLLEADGLHPEMEKITAEEG